MDRQLAGILRGLDIPRIYISEYGANYHYPTRVFETAQEILKHKLDSSRFQLVVKDGCAWLRDKVEWEAWAEKLSPNSGVN